MSQLAPAHTLAVLHLSAAAVAEIEALLAGLAGDPAVVTPAAAVAAAEGCASALPGQLRAAHERLASGVHEPALLIRGLSVDDAAIGPTPPHWRSLEPFSAASPVRREELLLTLLAQSIGELFGYATLQDGRLLHNIVPVEGAEHDQSGHGSEAVLDWHTEDAFTELRADYLGLLGLRNQDAIRTTFAGVDALGALPEGDVQVLFDARYAVVPDDEHLRSLARGAASSIVTRDRPTVMPVLRQTSRGRAMVIDRVYMSPVDEPAARAFARATDALDRALEAVAILPGDVLLLDNHRAVHGREPFTARYDGTDRWLLKASIARDLPTCATHRPDAASRTL